MSIWSGVGGLLGSIGRGLVGGIDMDAYDQAGGPLLGSIFQDQPQAPLPQAGLMAGPAAAAPVAPQPSGAGADLRRDLGAAGIAQPQQDGQWKPDAATRRMMRSMFLQNVGAGLGEWNRGTGDLASAMQNYRADTVNMLLMQHQAKAAAQQQAREQEAMAGFTSDMKDAGDDEDAQRKTMLKWGPYLPPQSLTAMGGIVKDFKKPTKKSLGIELVQQKDGSKLAYERFQNPDGSTSSVRQPDFDQAAAHALASAGDGRMYDVATNMTTPYPAMVGDGRKPRMVRQNMATGQFFDEETGQPIPKGVAVLAQPREPKADSEAAQENQRIFNSWGAAHGGRTGDQLTDTEKQQAILDWTKQKAVAGRDPSVDDFKERAALDSELGRVKSFYQPLLKEAGDHNSRLMVAQNALIQNDATTLATAAPAYISALIGGQGVRITQPEINQILNSQGIIGTWQNYFNKMLGHGALNPTQVGQMMTFLKKVGDLQQERINDLMSGIDSFDDATSRSALLNADKQLRHKLYDPKPQQGDAKWGDPSQLPKTAQDEVRKDPNVVTYFGNGQGWTMRNGVLTRVK